MGGGNSAEATKGKDGNNIHSEDQCRSQGTAAKHEHLVCLNVGYSQKECKEGGEGILNLGELLSLLRQPQIRGNESSHLFREEDLITEARIMNLAQGRCIKNKIIETTQCNNGEKRHLQSPDMSCWSCAQYP